MHTTPEKYVHTTSDVHYRLPHSSQEQSGAYKYAPKVLKRARRRPAKHRKSMILMLSHAQIDPNFFLSQRKKSIFFEKKNRFFFFQKSGSEIWKMWGDTPENEDYRVPHTVDMLWDIAYHSTLGESEASGAYRSTEKHSEITKYHENSWKKHEKTWKIMKNHEKSWKIMKNHDFLCWTAIAKQLPGALQKTKKTEKSPQNVPKSSWNGFSTPPKHFGVAEIPSGTV